MNDTWDITQDCQQNVDEEIGIAPSLQEDTDWWEKDGKDDLADISVEMSATETHSDNKQDWSDTILLGATRVMAYEAVKAIV